MPGASATGMLAPRPIKAQAMQELAAVAVTSDLRTESCTAPLRPFATRFFCCQICTTRLLEHLLHTESRTIGWGAHQAGCIAVIGVSIHVWEHTGGISIVRPLHRKLTSCPVHTSFSNQAFPFAEDIALDIQPLP